jgi:hypothetical protein
MDYLSIHHNIVSSTISETVNMQIEPISAIFDTDTITALKQRQNIVPDYDTNIPVQNIVIPATPSATITPVPLLPSIKQTILTLQLLKGA